MITRLTDRLIPLRLRRSPIPFFLFGLFAASLLFLLSCDDEPSVDTTGKDTTVQERTIDTAGLPVFSGQNAFDYVARQVSFGPRDPNSPGAQRTLAFLVDELKKYAANVRTQEFTHEGYKGEKLNLTNVIASFNPDAGTRVLFCAHWDTRPRADHDRDSASQDEPILGANDAGSGVGVLLELARVLNENPPPIGVDIVLFDGEDYGDSDVDELNQYFLGSRYFSSHLPPDYRPAFGVLLDIVGDIDAEFAKEGHSMQYASGVVNLLWQAAADLGLTHFKQRLGDSVQDDHLMLNEIAGIPTIDIIDAELVGNKSISPRRRYWHTHDDTMKNIGVKPLEEVGRLLVYTVYRVVPAELRRNASASR